MKILIAFLFFPLLSHAQELWEKPPPPTTGYHEKITRRIISYVQLPNDSSEYRKIQVYVQLLPDSEHVTLNRSIMRRRLTGAYLEKTGKKFKTLLNDGSLGREDNNLTLIDRLLNQENFSENSQ